MFFRRKKKYLQQIQELQESLNEEKENNISFQKTISILKEENNKLKNQLKERKRNFDITIDELNEKIKIMEKYYKLDEEPSYKVQARVIADLKLNDMKFETLRNDINKTLSLMLYNNIMQPYNINYYTNPFLPTYQTKVFGKI